MLPSSSSLSWAKKLPRGLGLGLGFGFGFGLRLGLGLGVGLEVRVEIKLCEREEIRSSYTLLLSTYVGTPLF